MDVVAEYLNLDAMILPRRQATFSPLGRSARQVHHATLSQLAE